jgi:CRP-like cAMP-binding protein
MALDFFAKRKLRKETKQLESQIKKGDDRPDLRLRLAGLYRKLGKDDEAKKQYLVVTQSYLDSNKRGQAEAVCKSVLEYYPENPKFIELFTVITGGNIIEPSDASLQTPFKETENKNKDKDKDQDEDDVDDMMDEFADADEPTPIATYNNFSEFMNDKGGDNWSESSNTTDENRIPSPPAGIPQVRASLQESITKRLVTKKNRLLSLSSTNNNDEVVDIFGDEGFFQDEGDTVVRPALKGDFWNEAPLLVELDDDVREELRSSIKPSFHEPDQYIFREGDKGDALFLIISGEVAVKKLQPTGEDEEIARLGKMEFFGEFALLADHKRHASILTIQPTSLLKIPKTLIVELGKKFPKIITTLKDFYKIRLQDLMINNLAFFELIAPENRTKYLGNLHFHRFAPNTSIIKQDSKSGGFFLILLGEVEIIHRTNDNEQVLGILGEGEYFGEMALMKRKTAMATVRSVDVVELVQIPAKTFFEILAEHPPIWRRLQEEVSKRTLLDHYFISGRGSGKLSF